jgi:C-terminal processing protease CtpA/Prc
LRCLNDVYTRKGNTTHQYWTSPSVSVIPFTEQLVYVLTSNHTFSAAEEFSYDLQAQKRAIIVGDTTGGAAHPVSGHLIADYFVVGVPWGSAINPLTEKSGEGTGVEPDVKVPAADALSSAEKLALAKITSK